MLTGYRILVIEDEAVIALSIRDALKDAGCDEVLMALTLAEAQHLSATSSCHAAIVDLRLRDGSTEAILHHLLATDCTVIVHSGHANSAEVQEQYPGAVFFSKPRPAEQLVQEIVAARARA